LERDNHCEAIIGAIPICAVVYGRWSKLSVKLFMKNIIFSLIFIVFAGCASPEKSTEAPPATAEVAPASEGKIDYDAINKSILKDVSKKIVDKASKKD